MSSIKQAKIKLSVKFFTVTKKVTVTLNGELYKKLSLIADLKCVSLVDVIEEMLQEKVDETDMSELVENYYSNR